MVILGILWDLKGFTGILRDSWILWDFKGF